MDKTLSSCLSHIDFYKGTELSSFNNVPIDLFLMLIHVQVFFYN